MSNDQASTVLADTKLTEEIESLRMQRRSDRARLLLDYIKAGAIALAAITIFIVLQRPDSLLNRTTSKESIARERAKLLLESLKETDTSKRLDSLMIIRVAYGSDGAPWLDDMEKVLRKKIEQETVLNRLTQIEQLRRRRQSLYEDLEREMNGTGGTGIPGLGPAASSIRREMAAVDQEIAKLTLELPHDEAVAQPPK